MLKSLLALRFHELPLHLRKFRICSKFRSQKLIVEIGCEIRNVNFGNHNYLGKNVVLRDSTIGDHSYINSNSVVVNTKIGKFCSIGPNVQIVLGSHPMNMVSTHPAFYASNKSFLTYADSNYFDEISPVEIGNDVWIGEGVLIPGGVKIGDGAVIASRSVVTRDVEPYSIVGGIPAKHIRYRFDQDLNTKIREAKWWDWSDDELEKHFMDFHDPLVFKEKHLK
jgi:phosphonate metabolism protein (transferase hexapeptide repeat family)